MSTSTTPPTISAFLLYRAPEAVARAHAAKGNDERRQADDRRRGQYVHLQKGEGDAHGQRVDAGGHGHHHKQLQAQRFRVLLFPAPRGFPDHLAADKGQQEEGDPVVERTDVMLKARAQQIARHRHQRLKSAEEYGDQKRLPVVDPAHFQPPADGDGKSVHRKSDGDEQQFRKRHT